MKLLKTVSLAAVVAVSLAAPAARAQFVSITTDSTVANGNPLNANFGTNVILLGAQANLNATRVPNVHIDIVDPAVFTYSNLVGRGVEAYSNTIVNVTGGAIGNGLSALDVSDVTVSGGTVNGAGTGTGGGSVGVTNPRLTINAGATITQGLLGSPAAYASIGTLIVNGGTLRNISNAGEGVRVLNTGTALIRGGTIQAVSTSDTAFLSMTGGTVNPIPGNNAQAVLLQSAITASITGGTINGGLRTDSQPAAGLGSAAIGGAAVINDGLFSLGANANALDIFGGTFGGVTSPATFFALGGGSINFYGTSLALSAPTPGSYTMPQGIGSTTYLGNFYTLTGTLRDGQSINRVLFDAVASGGSSVGLGGGFTTNPVSAAAPEPGTLALLALGGLPLTGLIIRKRRRA